MASATEVCPITHIGETAGSHLARPGREWSADHGPIDQRNRRPARRGDASHWLAGP